MSITPPRIREIPYNYTSFSDREIVIRFLGAQSWEILEQLRALRRTGRSARMLYEILGDLWMIDRNPFLQEELQESPKRLNALLTTMTQRLEQIIQRSENVAMVLQLVEQTKLAVQKFADKFAQEKILRHRTQRILGRITRPENIDFSGIARVSQVTDATDWRVAIPFVVLTPDSAAEIAPLVQACGSLGLTIIPRGGGTGYTGSGVPLYPDTVIINTERLDTLHPIKYQTIPGHTEPIATIEVEAGVITRQVSDIADKSGLIFAVDPTSQNASTIGGNIAMNAGGKKAVMWGTTLDNLLSWRMVTPEGNCLEVRRLNHHLGRIHDLKEVWFEVDYFQADDITPTGTPETICIPTDHIRKPGLGKDVTNKFLHGLPGVQKEGCDGLITRAVFILHKKSRFTHTVCLEFYGYDLGQAVPAIVEAKQYLDQHPKVGCAGLEHLDERYIRAIGYNAKASRGERPRMVLLIDIIGEELSLVEEATQQVVAFAQARNGEGFIATTPKGRERYWADRARTAAIAAHTNAFKINEDIVIPLERLADYNEGIERLNIEQSIQNKLQILQAVRTFLDGEAFALRLPADFPSSQEGLNIITGKRTAALTSLNITEKKWQYILHHLDTPAKELELLDPEVAPMLRPGDTLLRLLLRHDLLISYRRDVERPLKNLFGGDLWLEVRNTLDEIHTRLRSSRLFVALHMHAGDGNVHTNIPVNSNDYPMLREAERMVDRIMALALQLGGAVSGEHGIGLTKFAHLDPEKIKDFAQYKQKVDPEGRFNRGKLLPGANLEKAYTPSLRLVQQEALILRESALGDLNDKVRNCLRCGKCKAVCSTHVPRSGLLYSPRNKILAVGLIIEAFLYEEQTRRGLSIRHFDEMNDLADHCTVCHKCVVPCPVNIDFGEVTIGMREILKTRNRKWYSPGSRMALFFLTLSKPRSIRWMRQSFIQLGYAGQRLAYQVCKGTPFLARGMAPCSTNGRPNIINQLRHLLLKPLPTHLPTQTARASLDIEESDSIPILKGARNANGAEPTENVFYFPGCGCERLFSDISLATLALLHHLGVTTILPPGYLCCGFPQASSGDALLGRHLSTRNRVLLHRVANTLNYLDIKTVLISCGTCLNQLETYHFEHIFPGSRLMDIHEFLFEKNLTIPHRQATPFIFHDPCHTPNKLHPPLHIAQTLLNSPGTLTNRCCAEAGTFAVGRPDIATQVRNRKQADLTTHLSPTRPMDPPTKLITTCPSCFQGLSRLRDDFPIQPQFLVQELAIHILGTNWKETFLQEMKNNIEKVLL
ncbi:MAG: DUF3683 domain-containing protein [Magnetococcus sp. DMHC-6]